MKTQRKHAKRRILRRADRCQLKKSNVNIMPCQLNVNGTITNDRAEWNAGAEDFLRNRFEDPDNVDHIQLKRQANLVGKVQ